MSRTIGHDYKEHEGYKLYKAELAARRVLPLEVALAEFEDKEDWPDLAICYVPAEAFESPEWEDTESYDYCEVCGRATNHFAEHDDMVEAGFAFYDKNGIARLTDSGWDMLYRESYGCYN